MADYFVAMHRAHSGPAVAFALAARIIDVAREFFQGWRAVLAVFVLVGLTSVTADVVVGLTTAGLLMLAYLPYAHSRGWTLYYLELLPIPAFLAARGIWKCVNRGSTARAGVAVLLLLIVGAWCSVTGLEAARATRISRTNYAQDFTQRLAGLDSGKVLIFVRYGPRHPMHFSLVGNAPDLAADPRFATFVDVNLAENALLKGFQFHDCLVRLDIGNDVANFHLIAYGFPPLDQGSFGHRVAQFGHFKVGRHSK